jgi:hypothetical protein
MRLIQDLTGWSRWALPVAALEWLTEFIVQQQVRTVVECGSGFSTIALAMLQQQGILEGSLSLEHDLDWWAYCLGHLNDRDLLSYSDVRLRPLIQQQVHGRSLTWYGLHGIAPFAADLVLVDGPPSHGRVGARYPAIACLAEFLRPGTWVVLDDAQRQAEQQVIKRWVEEGLRLVCLTTFDKSSVALLQVPGGDESPQSLSLQVQPGIEYPPRTS